MSFTAELPCLKKTKHTHGKSSCEPAPCIIYLPQIIKHPFSACRLSFSRGKMRLPGSSCLPGQALALCAQVAGETLTQEQAG